MSVGFYSIAHDSGRTPADWCLDRVAELPAAHTNAVSSVAFTGCDGCAIVRMTVSAVNAPTVSTDTLLTASVGTVSCGAVSRLEASVR